MFGLGMGELLLILAVVLLFFGPRKIPQLAKGLGEAVREFKNSTKEEKGDKVETSKKG